MKTFNQLRSGSERPHAAEVSLVLHGAGEAGSLLSAVEWLRGRGAGHSYLWSLTRLMDLPQGRCRP